MLCFEGTLGSGGTAPCLLSSAHAGANDWIHILPILLVVLNEYRAGRAPDVVAKGKVPPPLGIESQLSLP